jgi:hypothetical protein
MSSQTPSLPGGDAPLFLAPATSAEPPTSVTHHPRPEPSAHMCTCGKVREACVHDEVRALWSAMGSR